jgi:predicted Fe-S protein YdhL (DUF1289 family)
MNDWKPAGDSPQSDELEARQRRREERRALRLKALAEGPPSPCISVCQIEESTGWCLGCRRTIDEIRDWIIMSPEERQRLLEALELRR